MLRRSQKLNYILAFNAKAKARPNFGLRGVGAYSSETYWPRYHNIISTIGYIAPMSVMCNIMYNGFFAIIDDVAGGGFHAMEDFGELHQCYNFQAADKPWHFQFPPGEGYYAGPPKYRPAEGAPELHH